jgi:hypothetical protein
MQGVARITKAIPPLRHGERLTVAEFERRYEAMPNVKKAELINGVVYMPSPVRIDSHGEQDSANMMWLGHYWAFTRGTQMGSNTTLKLLLGDNQLQPDALLRILPEHGGMSKTQRGYVVGGVEFAAEVSASSLMFDLHEKLHVFEQNGILEYMVWRVDEDKIDWFQLKAGQYQPLALTKDGLYKSKVFPGLWLDPDAMIAGDLIKVLEVVQQGIASPEHQRFVKKLQARKK